MFHNSYAPWGAQQVPQAPQDERSRCRWRSTTSSGSTNALLSLVAPLPTSAPPHVRSAGIRFLLRVVPRPSSVAI